MTDAERQPQTWHHGIVARWWAEFNVDGPEIAYFQKFIADEGEPALDLACGTGRLLLPYLRAGLDVDGCDVSSDMLALCRERAEAEGLSPMLFAQAMHELDLPRLYRTVVECAVASVWVRIVRRASRASDASTSISSREESFS